MTNNNRTIRTNACQALINGLKANASNPNLKTLLIGGTAYKNADAVAKLEQIITTAAAVAPAKAPYTAAVKADAEQVEATREFLLDLKALLIRMFNGQVEILAGFGLASPKRTKPSPETLVKAAAQAKATREARGTVGPKKKLAIKGVVPTAPETEPAADPAPAVASAPAPAQPQVVTKSS